MNQVNKNSGAKSLAAQLSSWQSVSAFIISTAIVVLCIKVEMKMLYAILLFFPILKTVNAVVCNNSGKFFSGVISLLLFLILRSNEVMIHKQLSAVLKSTAAVKEYTLLYNITFSVIFFILMMIAALISLALPKLEVPEKHHKTVMIGVFSFSAFMMMVLVYCVVAYCNGIFFTLPAIIDFLLPAIIAVLYLFIVRNMINVVKNCDLREVTAYENGLPVPAAADSASGEAEKSFKLEERPNTRLADVAGMEEVKKQIRLRLIEPIKHPGLAAKYGLKAGGGVLLYGPPGTGKTFIARAVAGELNLPFYMITSADVFGKYVGESEKSIKALFNNARKNPLSVVFIDELEVIFGKRTENIHETTQKVISVILQELDGVDQNKNPMLLLGATNTPWKVDEAFLRPGRFDILAFVDLPDIEARKQILNSAFKRGNLPLEEGLIDYMAENSKNFSGADLNGVVAKMRQNAYDSKAGYYSMDMAYEILLATTPSGSGELLRQIRQWEKERRV